MSKYQKIYNLLYLLANSDIISYEKLCKSFNIDNKTLTSLLDVLVMAGIIIEIRSYGRFIQKQESL
ncbi:MAG: hypothetical protein GW779_04980 [Candidatus Altiarchaeum hamiconexum]|uniref:Uncharacterized protein n=1 Tax=Candidatus Altarchaeum hamiconexum TaxID=1803513 RepID=A0A8J8CG14_9ARCH|nr:hypothetical protein [Candidatus Altarchaeum hamiconexum]NCN69291.1 hypothetical protein [Candidatus Altarchaeum hamiconexum]NCS91743.1 hypothetical protein [Candidatus Altarchaeum hamiconexum]NCT01403.1 hypothetical protein [Candidatus Altarchaeum hamiconexum]